MGLVNLMDLPELEIAPGVKAHIVTADSMTAMHVKIEAGSLIPEHSHHNEQIVNVIEGELELTVDGESYILTPGKVMILPSNIPHSGKAITDCKVIDAFHPVREDLRGVSFSGYDSE
jgi:quercetin dioxygenase-like cupin family protein